MKKTLINFFVICTFLSLIFSPNLTLAASTFDPHHIISDSEMRGVGSWTQNDIQNFLNNNGSYLSKYSTVDVVDNKEKTAAGIIYDAAVRYDINPKVLLVTLQKEQSLVEDSSPTQTQLDWATGYAVCDSCSTSDPKVVKHKGFATQVDDAAYTYDWYYKNKEAPNVKKAGVANNIDGQTVIPKSWATAFLYTYTPHLHGNENFYKIWNRWFEQTYPNGSLLKSADSGEIWLIQDNIKRKFKNLSVLITRADPNLIISVPETQLSNYSTGNDITFPNYSILKAGNNYYLLDYDTLKPFASYEVVKKLGYNPQEIIEVNSSDLTGLKTGQTITADAYAPQGIIYRLTDAGNQLFLIKDGQAKAFLDPKIAEINYKNLATVDKKTADLKNFTLLDGLLGFKDGTLLQEKNTSDIYVIENGQKRKFENLAAFEAMGYKKTNINTVDRITSLLIGTALPIYYNPNASMVSLNQSTSTQSNSNNSVAVNTTVTNNFAGDLSTTVTDHYGSNLPSYVVAEYPSGKILSGKNIDTKRPIASFVKVFVGYEALKNNLDYKKTTTYSTNKYGASGYSLAMADGAKITNKDVLNTMLIGSYNNMAKMTVAAAGLTETEMVAKINSQFKDWGANNTKIADVTGLSENNISTARDLLKIFTYSMKNEFDLQIILGKNRHDFSSLQGQSFSINHSNQMSFDNKDYKVLSSKTGYTDEAQSVLFLLIQAKNTGKRYVIITLGNPDYNYRFTEPAKIAQWISTNNSLNIASTN